MSDQPKARIVVTSGKHADLRPEIGVYEPASGKMTTFGQAGPSKALIEERVTKMKQQLERAGNEVEVIER